MYTEVSIAEKFTVAGCHDHYLNTDRKWWLFNFRKCTEVMKEGISSGLFSAAHYNGDQCYDIGPPCPIQKSISPGTCSGVACPEPSYGSVDIHNTSQRCAA